MDSAEIRKKFINFFKEKGHVIVASSSLIPADPTVLFTSAGMQQFIPYLSGKVESPYKRATSIQKCFRTSDIDEVGDNSHLTFFEMLGNWSFNEYFKEEAIEWALELLINNYQLSIDKLWVTVFVGGDSMPGDKEAMGIWKENGILKEKIKEFGSKDNFWGPVGNSGPCGPCSEIHYDRGQEFKKGDCTIDGCGPNCGCGRFVEIWNLVFMEYNKTPDGRFEKLSVKNIDTGAGFERLACVLQKSKSIFETDLFDPIIKKLEEISSLTYSGNEKAYRIIADHVRGVCFLISDGILPSKEDRGYVLRRILRRAIRYGNSLKIKKGFLPDVAKTIVDQYKEIYPELEKNRNNILTVIQNEEEKFEKTIEKGLKEFDKNIDGEKLFYLYETYGFPLELSIEELHNRGIKILENEIRNKFDQALKKHQETSRAGAQKKFGGHGAGAEANFFQEDLEKIKKLHTATHLLHATLRQILGKHVQQAGSDINPERLRFDFSHPQKLTSEEIKKIEDLVNQKIQEKLEISFEEMLYEDAIKCDVLAFFKERYPQKVKVYSASDFSREICAGPHVKNTSELGVFKIIKEESSGANMRRIKAILTEK